MPRQDVRRAEDTAEWRGKREWIAPICRNTLTNHNSMSKLNFDYKWAVPIREILWNRLSQKSKFVLWAYLGNLGEEEEERKEGIEFEVDFWANVDLRMLMAGLEKDL